MYALVYIYIVYIATIYTYFIGLNCNLTSRVVRSGSGVSRLEMS